LDVGERSYNSEDFEGKEATRMERLSEAIGKVVDRRVTHKICQLSTLEKPLLQVGRAENKKPVQALGCPVCGQRIINRKSGHLTDILMFVMMLSLSGTITVCQA
jgi:hypothetical protein